LLRLQVPLDATISCPTCQTVISYERTDVRYFASGWIDLLARSSLRLSDSQRNHVLRIPQCNAVYSFSSFPGASSLWAAPTDGTTTRIAGMPDLENVLRESMSACVGWAPCYTATDLSSLRFRTLVPPFSRRCISG